MKHKIINVKCVRYVYMLDVDNHGSKSKYFGQRRIFYTGQTSNLGVRLMQHLCRVNSVFLGRNFRDARKKLVFVEQLWGDEYDAIGREWEIKRLSRVKKLELIRSGRNDLIEYVPLKAVILRRFGQPDELEVLKIA